MRNERVDWGAAGNWPASVATVGSTRKVSM
jgi:hypothetical protein